MQLQYYTYYFLSKLFGNSWIQKYYKKAGMRIGNGTHIFSKLSLSEPYLISIGNNTTIATNVSFITHDSAIGPISDRQRFSDLCGKITIGNNCFIGANSIILYGVTVADGSIVAAGSVLTKSFSEPGIIIAGCPAKKIGYTKDYVSRYENYFFCLDKLSYKERKKEILSNEHKLIIR